MVKVLHFGGDKMIGRLVECKHSGNLGIVVDEKGMMFSGKHEHILVQFEVMKVWLRSNTVEVIK